MAHLYGEQHRALQDEFGTRRLADALEAFTVKPHLDDDAVAFVGSRPFFFLSTVNAEGHPTVSFKGGAPGFVRVPDPSMIVWPDYDGNGMYLSMGNIAGDGRIGLLFIDFERPHRVRVQARAAISRDRDDLAAFPGADLVVRATVTEAFVNCGRYIPTDAGATASPYVPDERGDAPLPAWKKIDLLQDVLPAPDQGRAGAEGGTITFDEYDDRVRRGEP